MKPVRCETCKHWDGHGVGLGACKITRSDEHQGPQNKSSKAIAFAVTPDGRISEYQGAVLFTESTHCCSQFSRGEANDET